MTKRKTEIVTLRKGKTNLLALPFWALENIDPNLFKGLLENRYFRVSVKDNVITYEPIIFYGAVYGCEHQGADPQ